MNCRAGTLVKTSGRVDWVCWSLTAPRVSEIAVELDVSDKSLYRWAHAGRTEIWWCLLVGHKGGCPRALCGVMIATAVEATSDRIGEAQAGRLAYRGSSCRAVALPSGNAVSSTASRRILLQKWPVLAQKERDAREFAVKADTLSKLQRPARDGACRPAYVDQSGFCASPPEQRGLSPLG